MSLNIQFKLQIIVPQDQSNFRAMLSSILNFRVYSFCSKYTGNKLVLLGIFTDSQDVHAEEGSCNGQLGPPHVDGEHGILARPSGVEGESSLGEQAHEDAVNREVQLGKLDLVHADSPWGESDGRHPCACIVRESGGGVGENECIRRVLE